MSRQKKGRWRAIAAAGLVVVLVAAFFVYRGVHNAAGSTTTRYVTAAVQLSTLTSSVSGSGNVVVGSSASVDPGISGQVSGLTVKLGDSVSKGQLLFTVVNPQLALDVTSAQNSYDQAVQGVSRAQLTLLQDQQKLDQLEQQLADQSTSTTSPPTTNPPTTTSTIRPTTTRTSPTTTTTQPPSSTTTTQPPSSTSSTQPPTATGTTTTTAAGAQTSSAAASPVVLLVASAGQQSAGGSTVSTGQSTQTGTTVSELDIEVAQQQIASDQLAIRTAKTQVESATLSLQQAKDNAAKWRVRAPISGVVTTLNVKNGDTLGSSSNQTGGQSTNASSSSGISSPIVLTDGNSFQVSVSLTETDIPSVKVGQKAVITLDALPDLSLSGTVNTIDTSGTNNQGVVSYGVGIALDATNDQVKPGMTASASVITEVKSDVLVVANAAVKTSGGQSYVQILRGGTLVGSQSTNTPTAATTQTTSTSGASSRQTYEGGTLTDQAVQVGISNDTYTEITSGLNEGQEVIVQTITTGKGATTTTGRGGTGIPGLGGGGFGGAGRGPGG